MLKIFKMIHSREKTIVIIPFMKGRGWADSNLEHGPEDRRPGAEDVCVARELLHGVTVLFPDLQHDVTEKLLRACQQLGEVGAKS